jgi:hypothetical protein
MPALAPVRAEVVMVKEVCGVTVAAASACVAEFDELVAVMVTEVLLETLGAVKTPVLEIVPALVDQVTAVSALPLSVAVNCCFACDARFALVGEIVIDVPLEFTVMGWLFEELDEPRALHPTVRPVRLTKSKRMRRLGTRALSALRRFATAECWVECVKGNLATE